MRIWFFSVLTLTLRVGFFTTLILNDSFTSSALAEIVTLPVFLVSRLPYASKSATEELLDFNSTLRSSLLRPALSNTSTENSVIVPTYSSVSYTHLRAHET